MTEPYRVLVADPCWRPGDSLPGKSRGASKNYKTLSVAELKAFPLPPLADDCVLFLWRLAIMQREAFEVAGAWGFRMPERELVWRKLTPTGKEHFGMGHVVRGAHETMLIALRGRPKVLHRSQRSLFSAEVPRVDGKVLHSGKPDAAYEIIRGMYEGPRAALFERKHRPGFDCFGDELTPQQEETDGDE